jgi:hypothetical protein
MLEGMCCTPLVPGIGIPATKEVLKQLLLSGGTGCLCGQGDNGGQLCGRSMCVVGGFGLLCVFVARGMRGGLFVSPTP